MFHGEHSAQDIINEGNDGDEPKKFTLPKAEISPDLRDATRRMKAIQRPPRDKMLKSSKGK